MGIKKSDLYSFALWQATTDGGRSLVPKAWGGRFPFQVKVSLTTPEIVELPKATIPEHLLNPATGKFDNIVDPPRVQDLLSLIRTFAGGARGIETGSNPSRK
jgi:hypothetical protein